MRGGINTGSLADKEGRHYQLSIDDADQWWVLKLFDGLCPIGYANCLYQGKVLFLADLCISDDVPPTGRLACWARMFGLRLRHKNYRGRGLGSALLGFIIEQARRNGIEHITGKLFPADLAKNPEPHLVSPTRVSCHNVPGQKLRGHTVAAQGERLLDRRTSSARVCYRSLAPRLRENSRDGGLLTSVVWPKMMAGAGETCSHLLRSGPADCSQNTFP